MYRINCPVCRSPHTMKNGRRNGVQLYICRDCKHQFRNYRPISEEHLWEMYSQKKQTVSELASSFGVSASTIKRRLKGVGKEWVQPPLSGSGFVHIDATYWGRNTGILLAMDSGSGLPMYLAFIHHERQQDYLDAVESIEARGYVIKGIIIDGLRPLFKELSGKYPMQMCQFHMKQIVRRGLTLHPRLLAARELKSLVDSIVDKKEADFRASYDAWKETWRETLTRKTVSSVSGKWHYTHRRLRAVVNSIDFFLPYLFTYQREDCEGMPNTNNKVEGTFTDLKKNLNNHSGMSSDNRKRFVSGFFLALLDTPSMCKEKQGRR